MASITDQPWSQFSFARRLVVPRIRAPISFYPDRLASFPLAPKQNDLLGFSPLSILYIHPPTLTLVSSVDKDSIPALNGYPAVFVCYGNPGESSDGLGPSNCSGASSAPAPYRPGIVSMELPRLGILVPQIRSWPFCAQVKAFVICVRSPQSCLIRFVNPC